MPPSGRTESVLPDGRCHVGWFERDVPGARLDVAGPTGGDEEDDHFGKGGTGFSVRTIVKAVTKLRPPGRI